MHKWHIVFAACLMPLATFAHAGEANRGPAHEVEHELEGPPELRDAYKAQRRANPINPQFDTAAARLAAVNQANAAARRLAAGGGTAKLYRHTEAWQPIGPTPLLNGETPWGTPQHLSPVSGRVTAIALDAPDEVAFIGSASGGVWRTSDGGQTWAAIGDQLGSLAIGSIALAPGAHARNQATLYVGTGEGNFGCDSYGGVGVYKSTDSGHTWQGPYGSAFFTNRAINSIVVDRTNPNVLFATTGSAFASAGGSCIALQTFPPRGVYKSTDGGLTWAQLTTQAANDPASKVIQDPITPTRWWAAMYANGGMLGGVLRSDDNGATWTQIAGTGGLPPLDATGTWSRAQIAATDDGAGHAVVYVSNGQTASGASTGGRVFRSADGGSTWTELVGAQGFCNTQCWYDSPIAAEPGNANVVYTGGSYISSVDASDNEITPSEFMRSDNAGSTATFASKVRSADGLTALHADLHAIQVWPGRNAEIWVGNDGGVWKSTDRGEHWINLNSNLQITQFEQCDLYQADPNIAYCGTQDNGVDGFVGSSGWLHLDYGDGGTALIDQDNADNLVHTYYDLSGGDWSIGVGYTTGGFGTLENYDFSGAAKNNPPYNNGINYLDRVLWYPPIHLDAGVHDTLYFGTNILYRADSFFSYPTGAPNIFTPLGSGTGGQDLALPSGAISAITTLANLGHDAQTIYTGASNGHVFRSSDGGVSFVELDVTPAQITLFVSAILIDPRDPNTVYQARAGFTGSLPAHNVRKSTDGGNTWADASTGLPDIPVNALAADPISPHTVWAGTDAGVFVSTDGGATWNPYDTGLPNVQVFDLKTSRHPAQVVAFTHGRGAYRLLFDAIFIDGFDGP